jgi:hypothetical protein
LPLAVQPAFEQHTLADARGELRRQGPFHRWHLLRNPSPRGAGGRRVPRCHRTSPR